MGFLSTLGRRALPSCPGILLLALAINAYSTRIRSGVRMVDLEGDLSSGDSGEWSFCRAGGVVA